MLILIRIHIFLPFYYTAINMTRIGILKNFSKKKIYKHMFLFLLTTTRLYDIMQKYRGNVACTLLSCRRSGMTASPCNKELCGRYLFPRVRSKFSAMFRRTMCRTRAVWKDVRWQAFLVVRFFRKCAVVIASFRTRRDGLFKCTLFFGKHGPERRKHDYNLTEWLTTIERKDTAK